MMNFLRSKTTFFVVLGLILLLPVLVKCKLLLFGIHTQGKVVELTSTSGSKGRYGGSYNYPIIEFQTKSYIYSFGGPSNQNYKLWEMVPIAYDQKEPNNNMILSMSGIYSGLPVMFGGLLMLIWVSFYFSLPQKFRSKLTTMSRK